MLPFSNKKRPDLRLDSFFRWTPGLPGTLSFGGGIGPAAGYLFAVFATLIAAVINHLWAGGFHDPLYMDFVVAILATQLVAGVRPAVASFALSAAFVLDIGIPPALIGVSGHVHSFRFLNFLLVALAVVLLNTRSALLHWQAHRWKKKFLPLAGSGPDMSLFEWDIKRGDMIWSERLSALSDLQPGESYRDRVHEEDRARVESALQEAVRTGTDFDLHYRIRGPAGEERWIAAAGHFLNGRSRPRWVIGTMTDATDLLQAHERLRAVGYHFELAQKMALMATWEWRVNSPEIQWSPGSGPVYGHSGEDFSLSVDEFFAAVHPQDGERLKALYQRGLRGQQDFEAEFRYSWPDGSLHWLFSRARPLRDENGVVRRLIGVTLEITARKRAEDALRASERLAANGRLAATLAHEINTPLNSLRSVMFLIEHHAGSSPAVRRYLEMGQREIVHAAEIIRQTLGLYREPKGVVSASPRMEIEQVLVMYQARARRDRIAVDSRIEFDGAVPVLPGEIRQILTNLLLNAIDAGARRLRIHLYLSHVVDGARHRVVRLVVADDGAGISSPSMTRLFEPFYTTKGEKGTGLGLWVVSNIVRKYGGSIDVRSSQQAAWRGTTFMIRLPLESPPILSGLSAGEELEEPMEPRGMGEGFVSSGTSAQPGAA